MVLKWVHHCCTRYIGILLLAYHVEVRCMTNIHPSGAYHFFGNGCIQLYFASHISTPNCLFLRKWADTLCQGQADLPPHGITHRFHANHCGRPFRHLGCLGTGPTPRTHQRASPSWRSRTTWPFVAASQQVTVGATAQARSAQNVAMPA